MLSEPSKIIRPSGDFAPLAEPRVVRLSFSKKGAVIFTSHLDLQRTMMRILARADLPLWYTQGFNPHAKLVFGLMDIRIERDMPCDEILERMRRATVPGITFTECYPANEKYAGIASASYRITLRLPEEDQLSAGEVEKYLSSRSIITVKKTKSGETETDIAPLIRSVSVSTDGVSLVIDTVLAAGCTENLSPELLMSVLVRNFGSRAQAAFGMADSSVIRTGIYRADGRDFR